MLDVHPPHHPTHTWRDFFLHIATICVGLLIAIALEQAVEALHRRHEHRQLQAALESESRQIVHDTSDIEADETREIQWLRQCEAQISGAVRDHHLLAPLPTEPEVSWDIPDDPSYKAAKASTKLDLLSDEETVAYGELDGTVALVQDQNKAESVAEHGYKRLLRQLGFALSPGVNPLASASPADLKELHSGIVDFEEAAILMRDRGRVSRGAALALSQGERDLHKIQAAERQFDNLP